MTGKSEKALIAAGKVKGKDYDTIIITQNHHAGYYPGAQPLTIKVIFTPDGSRILGAQIVGAEGVDNLLAQRVAYAGCVLTDGSTGLLHHRTNLLSLFHTDGTLLHQLGHLL